MHIITELFGNTIQGEGRFMGQPTIFIRYFGCTLRCPGFSMKRGEKTTELDLILTNLDKYELLEDLPLVKTGCDSYPSVYPEFIRYTKKLTTEEIAKRIIAEIPTGIDFSKYHVCFTGGEPFLYQKDIFELMNLLYNKYHIYNMTFETNGTVKLRDEIANSLNPNINITISVSPKLSVSGNPKEKSLKPFAVKSYNNIKNSYLYYKYVVRGKQDLEEIKDYMAAYKKAGVEHKEIYLMPEGGVVCEETSLTEKEVVDLCIKNGYRFSPRLHLALFGNKWGA